MSEQLLARLCDLQERDGHLMPNAVLGSAACITAQAADVFLDPRSATECLDQQLADAPEADWAALRDTAADVGDEVTAGYAARRCLELRLIRLACEQVVGRGQLRQPVNNSSEIAAVQEQLYGHYDPQLFRSALSEKVRIVSQLTIAPELEPARAILLDELDTYIGSEPVEPLAQPTAETLGAVRDWLNDQFGDLFAAIDAEGVKRYDAEGIRRIFQLGIDTTPMLQNLGWQAVAVYKEKNVVAVKIGARTIEIPLQRTVGPSKLKKLLVHEVLGHALRSAIAEANQSHTGRHGTATYGQFEESFEIALEQCVDGKIDIHSKLDTYIAIGMAVTHRLSVDRIGHLFRSLHMFAGASKGITPGLAAIATGRATLQLQRTFEGMTDVDEGVVNLRDINYLHGLDSAWRLLNAMTQRGCLDQGMRWLFLAKFNPYDADDRKLVQSINQTADNPCPMPLELDSFFAEAA